MTSAAALALAWQLLASSTATRIAVVTPLALLTIVTVTSYMMTTLTDPGIMPKD